MANSEAGNEKKTWNDNKKNLDSNFTKGKFTEKELEILMHSVCKYVYVEFLH